MWGDIIHSKLLTGSFADLSDFFASTCTIQEKSAAQDAYHEELDTYTDLAGHVGLSCAVSPSGGREVKRPDMTYVIATHHVTLAGYYPGINEKMQAVVNGTALDILLVEHDSQHETTRLACRLTT